MMPNKSIIKASLYVISVVDNLDDIRVHLESGRTSDSLDLSIHLGYDLD